MKSKILFVFILVVLWFCKSDKNSENNSDKGEKKYKQASQIIYNNSACLDENIETLPVLEIQSDTIYAKDSIRGKLYFSTNYLRELAKCNSLDYKITFSVYNSSRRVDTSFVELKEDTVNFTSSYDSLKLLNTSEDTDEYLLEGKLRASYFKLNEVLGYDTMMQIQRRIYIMKKE